MAPLYHSAQHVPTTSGIYCITCTITSKIYIGSALNLQKRRNEHWFHLARKTHRNPKLQNAWNKYGEESFTFEILELVLLPDLLTAREQYWFSKLKPFDRKGFNIAKVAGSTLGVKPSPEKCEKIGAAQRGRPAHNRGKKLMPEQLERYRATRASLKGQYKPSEETKRKMAEAHKGSKRNSETREKMRLAALGHAPTNARTFIVTSPDGTEYVVHGLAEFCREHHLRKSCLYEVAKGYRSHHKGWKAQYSD